MSPPAYGPSALLSALYDFSPYDTMRDIPVTTNMQRIQNRFLAEILQDTFSQNSKQPAVLIPGSRVTSLHRLVVVHAVAITLEVVIGAQLALLMGIFRSYKT